MTLRTLRQPVLHGYRNHFILLVASWFSGHPVITVLNENECTLLDLSHKVAPVASTSQIASALVINITFELA